MTLKKYKEVWKQIDRIDTYHVLKNTPKWEQKEIDAVVSALSFHNDDTKSNLNGMYHRRISASLTQIIQSDKTPDYLTMNVLKDQVHDMWRYGFREVQIKWKSDNTGEQDTAWFSKERFYKLWAGNDKRGDDVTENQRFYFLYNFIKSVNKELGDCFQTYVHDFYQKNWGIRSTAEYIEEVNNIYGRGIIPKDLYVGFIKRSSELIKLKAGTGEWTWKEPDLYTKVWAEYLFIRNLDRKKREKDHVECYTMNCREMVKLSIKEYATVIAGRGLNVKYCKKHAKNKTNLTV